MKVEVKNQKPIGSESSDTKDDDYIALQMTNKANISVRD